MVARITTPKRLHDALNYNEQKVQKGKAECIYAGNYLLEAADMNFYQKLKVMDSLITLNERASTKTLHVSLNFDPSEKLSAQILIEIGSAYMEKIGFGEQPYLIYRHFDAAHPHLHIVTTTIRDDGSRINTHNIGRNQSESARKEIEQIFNLVKAENQSKLLIQRIRPVNVNVVLYGKDETKRSISNIVTHVMSEYKFTSLPEFNAVLQLFNVVADRGKEGSRTYKHGGLVYRLIDEKGKNIGVPIKASLLSGQPILKKVMEKCDKIKSIREPFKRKLIARISKIIATNPSSLENLKRQLKKEMIEMILRRSVNGKIYGITYIDLKYKSVFNGSDLGKEYAASGVIAKVLSMAKVETINDIVAPGRAIMVETKDLTSKKDNIQQKTDEPATADYLLSPEKSFESMPFQLRKRKKKKRKVIQNK